jgi:hypothetical protein
MCGDGLPARERDEGHVAVPVLFPRQARQLNVAVIRLSRHLTAFVLSVTGGANLRPVLDDRDVGARRDVLQREGAGYRVAVSVVTSTLRTPHYRRLGRLMLGVSGAFGTWTRSVDWLFCPPGPTRAVLHAKQRRCRRTA